MIWIACIIGYAWVSVFMSHLFPDKNRRTSFMWALLWPITLVSIAALIGILAIYHIPRIAFVKAARWGDAAKLATDRIVAKTFAAVKKAEESVK